MPNKDIREVGFCINPPIIIPWLSEEQRKKNIILLDIDFDIDDNGANRIDLDVVFNPISIKTGNIQRVDYYVGSSGAEIAIDVSDGTILEYTQAAKLDDTYENNNRNCRSTTLNLSPLVNIGTIQNIGARITSIIRHATERNTYNTRFTCGVRYLRPIVMGKSVKWMLTLPQNENMVRDFLIGNLYLFVTCIWQNNTKSGSVHIRPSDIRFFDSDYQPVGKSASVLMQFILWKSGIKLDNCDGFSISFEEKVVV